MKVLLIEQAEWSYKEELAQTLKNYPEIKISSCDFHDATTLLMRFHFDVFDVCVIDACKGPDRQSSTVPLVIEIQKIFKGKIIAISNTAPSRVPLEIVGCQYGCAKGRLAELLVQLIETNSERYFLKERRV